MPLKQQRDDDLIWIRKPFLNRPHGLPYIVVHGHTFGSDYRITRLPHRIGIDTGAFKSGQLTALPLEPWTNPENQQVARGKCIATALDPPSARLDYSKLLIAVIEMECQMPMLAIKRTSFGRPDIHTSSTSDPVHHLSRLRSQ